MRSRPWTADLARMGKLVVAVALAGRSHGTAFLDRRGDLPLPLEDDRHQLRHLGGPVEGDHDHARAVRPEQVAGADPDAADRDRDVGPQHADPVLARAHEHPPGEDRVGQAGDLVEVAAGPVDDRPGDSVALGEDGQQPAPDGAVDAPAVGQQDHAPGRYLVDVLRGRSKDTRLHRLEEDGIGRSAAAGAGPDRAQVGQPAGDPQHAERIGDHGNRGAGEDPWSGRGRGRAHAAAGWVSITDTFRPPWNTFTFSARLALAPKPAKRPARMKVSQLTRMAPAETPSPWPSRLTLSTG